MAATADRLRDVTMAEGSGALLPPEPRGEPYASANQDVRTRLILPGPKMQLQSHIIIRRRRYVLRGVFAVDLTYLEKSGQVVASHRSLPVHGYGEDEREALNDFCETFDFQWRNLVEVHEESLTSGGRRRREAMQRAVEAVEQLDA